MSEASESGRHDAVYTRGPIGPTMLKNAVSMIAGTLAMSGYNLADAYFVGRLPGATPQAAVGFTFPVIMLAGCLFRGLSGGTTTTAAHALGAKNRRRADRLVTSGLLLLAAVSVVFGALGMATAAPLFELFGARGETLELVCDYMNVWYFGCLTASLSMAGNDLLIAYGAPRTASILMIVGMAANVLLDPVLIFGWGPVPAMGVRGAAVATVISQGLSTALVLWKLRTKFGLIHFRRLSFRSLRPLWGVIVRFGVPVALGALMMPIGSTVITYATASFGDVAVAATATAGRLEILAFMVPMAFGWTMTPMVGQNYGARLYSRIRECRRFSMRFALVYLLLAALGFYFGAEALARQFSLDAEVREWMALYFRVIPWGFAFLEIHRFSTFVFTGCARPGASAWLNALRMLGLLIPLTLLAWHWRTLPGLYLARLTADVLAGSIGWTLSSRLTRRLPSDGEPQPRAIG